MKIAMMKKLIRIFLLTSVVSGLPFNYSQAAGPIYYQYNMVDLIFVNGQPDPIWYSSDYVYTSIDAAMTAGCKVLGPVSRTPNVGSYIRWSFYDGFEYDFYRCHYVNTNDPTNEITLIGSTGFYTILHSIRPHTDHPSCSDGSGNDYYFDPGLQQCTLEDPAQTDLTDVKKQLGTPNCDGTSSVLVGD